MIRGVSRSVLALAVLAVTALVPGAPLAPLPTRATPNRDARLALHLLPRTTKNPCTRTGAAPACSGIITNGSLYPSVYFAYLLVTNGEATPGIGGLQCGVSYNGAPHTGIDVFSWNLCATLEFVSNGWPASGGGNLMTWDTGNRCQRTEPGGAGTGVVATAGYFYLGAYGPDVLQLTRRPVDNLAKVADCSSNEVTIDGGGINFEPSHLGSAAFSPGGLTPGYNPCAEPAGPVDCTIAGPDSVDALSTGNTYAAAVVAPETTYQWAVSGNASIPGASTGTTVSLTAGTGGDATVYLTATRGATSNLCSKVIHVRAPVTPQCTIAGADTASEGNPDVTYSVSASGPYTSVSWSITGDGVITSSLTATSVHVQVGDIGAFELTATLHGPGPTPSSCVKTVTVVPVRCLVIGQDAAPAFATAVPYTSGPARIGATYLWQIFGNGSINGSATGPSVLVTAGAPGQFTLSVTIHRSGHDFTCGKAVTVQASTGGGSNNQANAKIMIHLRSPTTKNGCGTQSTPTCAAMVTSGALYPTNYFAYLVVVEGNQPYGVGGLQCGLDYNGGASEGVDIFDWTLCATLEFSSGGVNGPWPAAGSGNLITWDVGTRCQRSEPQGAGTGVTAAAGYFYCAAYSQDILSVIPRPVDGKAKVADCAANESLIGGIGFPPYAASHLGTVRFGGGSGYNPCGAVYPVRMTTWSAIKATYGSPAAGQKDP